MKFEIQNRWNGEVLFSFETENIKLAVEAAVKYGANLDGANLYSANLYRANLSRANLYGANLYSANLYGANLYGANNIPEAYYTRVRDDIWAILPAAPAEVEGLRTAIIEGRINGSTYEGECACLVGTIANVKAVHFTQLRGLKPNSGRPAEQWFLQIRQGHTPENNDHSKRALEWIDQWLANMRAAFAVK